MLKIKLIVFQQFLIGLDFLEFFEELEKLSSVIVWMIKTGLYIWLMYFNGIINLTFKYKEKVQI